MYTRLPARHQGHEKYQPDKTDNQEAQGAGLIKIYEYQARELLAAYGIAVPRATVARTVAEAVEAAAALGGRVMIKAQVLTGGRGKAGAVKAVASAEEAQSAAKEILAMRIKGFTVKCVMVAERLEIRAEYYVGITIDRQAKSVILIISTAGGIDIEETAAKEPQGIRRFVMAGPNESPADEALSEWLSATFSDKAMLEQAVRTTRNMYRLFREKDCSLVEVNPLAVTAQGQLVAADAKIVFDDNGIPRHPDIAQLRNPEEYTPEELQAREAGLSFVSLDGEIGCMVNGAGLAMATMDGIKLAGGSVANFLDVGGSSNPQKVVNAMQILLKNEKLKVILVNIFGGITRCDDIARGILTARERLDIRVPLVVRLIGTNEQEGLGILRKAGMIVNRSMTETIRNAVDCARGGSPP
jgi:succinyl-CoA synthetase beta subunit